MIVKRSKSDPFFYRIHTISLVFFIGLATDSSIAKAESFLGEEIFSCHEYEVVVWGDKKDVRISRDEKESIDVKFTDEIVWFCGRTKKEFTCPRHNLVELLEIEWSRSGSIRFVCLGQ